jgi:hypothetical protein
MTDLDTVLRDIERLRGLHAKATPTPWNRFHNYMDCPQGLCPDANRHLIVETRNVLPSLLDGYERAVLALKAAEAVVAAAEEIVNDGGGSRALRDALSSFKAQK